MIGKLKTTLITGLLIVLPAWLALLLYLQLLVKLEVIVQPFTKRLPDGINHPTVLATLLFLLTCFLVGLLFYTAFGKLLGRWFAARFMSHVPGYSAFRSIADQFQDLKKKEGFKPALIVVEDGSLAPAFLIEECSDQYCAVFMPSSPTPLAGGIFIMKRDRVHPIDVSVSTMMRCISKWGAGSRELLAAYQNPDPEAKT